MTREEAIKWLKGIEEKYIHGGDEGFDAKRKEALFRAIQALEQENKIRAEIEQTAKDYDKFDDIRRVRGLWIALDIIDKYTAESEEK